VTALLRAELLKLTTTRTARTFAALATLIVVGFGALLIAFAEDDAGTDELVAGDVLLVTSAYVVPLFFLLGVIASAGEHRHGTITPTFLVAPDRLSVMAAKLIVAVACGASVALGASALAGVAITPLTDRQLEVGATYDGYTGTVIGLTVATALAAAAGVALGEITRNQAVALIAAFLIATVVPGLVSLASDDVASLLPVAAIASLLGAEGEGQLGQVEGGLVALAWVAAASVAAAALTRRRDVV
jgi:ABC-2 type transport system permease protein